MPKELTLQRVRDDIERGYLGKARDRLHGLIITYPDDLSLRVRLAEVYLQLRHPGMAGLYWYLASERSDEIQTAIAEFERECGGDPWLILNRLRIRWDPQEMPEGYAKNQIDTLISQCQEKHGCIPQFSPSGGPDNSKKDTGGIGSIVGVLGCGVVVFVVVLLLVLGAIQLLSLLR